MERCRSSAGGLTSQQLAHHDLVTGESQGHKDERQKASIDRWNQEVTNPPELSAEPEPEQWSQTTPPAAQFGLGSVHQAGEYHQLSYDDHGAYQGDHYPGHQSSMSHDPPMAESQARRYDPYDLSPAYLGSYPDEAADPSSHFDSYLAPPQGPPERKGHTHDSYDAPYQHTHTHPGQQQAATAGADNSYLSGNQDGDYLSQGNNHYDYRLPAVYDSNASGYQNSQSQYQRTSSQDPSPFDFGVQQSYPSQNRQQQTQSGRDKNDYGGVKPQQPSTINHQSHAWEEDQWGQPSRETAASGWDDSISQNATAHVTAGDHMGQIKHNDYSQWQAPIEGGHRQRPNQARGPGKGKGSYQQKQPGKKVSDAHMYKFCLCIVT